MPNFTQLPKSDHANAADVLPINQNGRTVSVSVATLQSSLQPQIVLPRNMLLGRSSIGAGGPEPITIGAGLSLDSGTLTAIGGTGTGTAGQGFTFKGAWTPGTTYAAYDVLTYGGQTYVVTAALTTSSTFSLAGLQLLAAQGASGATGPAGATGPQGPAGAGAVVGTTAGTVAAGNDARIVQALQPNTTLAAAPDNYNTAQRAIVISRGAYPQNGMFGWNIQASQETFTVQTQVQASDVSGSAPVAIAGYANVLTTKGGGVGVFGQGTAGADATGVFGGNFLAANYAADDVFGSTGHNLNVYGVEVDVNISPLPGGAAPAGGAFGVHISGGSTIRPLGSAYAIHIDPINGYLRNVKWTYGVFTEDGATDKGIWIGADKNTGVINNVRPNTTNSGNQGIYLNTIDTAGVPHQAVLTADAASNLLLSPGQPGAFVVIGYGASALKASSGNLDLPATGALSSGSGTLGFNGTDATGANRRASILADASGNLLLSATGAVLANGSQVATAAAVTAEAARAQAAETALNASLSKVTLPSNIIQGLGDSITAQSSYQPSMTPPPTFPAWAASTAYAVGQCVANGGYGFTCTAAGTSAASGGPVPSTSAVTDAGVTWKWLPAQSSKDSFLGWAESFSQGALVFDQTQGYSGPAYTLKRVVVRNGGSGYGTNPTIVLNQGASATATVVGGVITSVTVTNPGYGTAGFTVSVTDGTGTGAALTVVQDGSGTFGVFGATTADMVARLPECLASTAGIFTVMGGRNDAASNVPYTAIIANLRTCYETLINAGRCVVAIPVLPSTVFTAAQSALVARVNRWIRSYVRQLAWANPSAYTKIAIADCTKFFTDGTVQGSFWPVGGTGGTPGAVMLDGTHPNTRGRIYLGAAIAQACLRFTGSYPLATSRPYSGLDGYDPSQNPGGNLLEGLAWTASTAYVVGQLRANNANLYRITAAGTSAAGGGPAGTGSGIADGTVTWAYVRPAGMSVMAGGSAGTQTATTGITYSGGVATGWTLLRGTGSASGTVACSIESPWTDGTIGQRQVLAFSLGNGTNNEQWQLRGTYNTYASAGILATELGSTQVYAEAEIEIINAVNVCGAYLSLYDNTIGWYNYSGATATGTSPRLPAPGDAVQLPNNGRLVLRTTNMVLPPGLANFNFSFWITFDASGTTAGSAAATVKVNYMGIFRALAA